MDLKARKFETVTVGYTMNYSGPTGTGSTDSGPERDSSGSPRRWLWANSMFGMNSDHERARVTFATPLNSMIHAKRGLWVDLPRRRTSSVKAAGAERSRLFADGVRHFRHTIALALPLGIVQQRTCSAHRTFGPLRLRCSRSSRTINRLSSYSQGIEVEVRRIR